MEAKDRIVVAIDSSDADEIDKLVGALVGHVGLFKIGLEVLHKFGPQGTMTMLRHATEGKPFKVMYDAKLNDIPNTMKGSMAAIATLPEVDWVTVHANSGIESVHAAVGAAAGKQVVAVTLLTSIDERESERMYNKLKPDQVVLELADGALKAGAHGLVCAMGELGMLRAGLPLSLAGKPGEQLRVVPGVRPKWYGSGRDDQVRPTTPFEAILRGATHLVIGRPITKPNDRTPVEAAQSIASEIEEALRDQP
jgi:orotidine-5'-phosphate decarboxylase